MPTKKKLPQFSGKKIKDNKDTAPSEEQVAAINNQGRIDVIDHVISVRKAEIEQLEAEKAKLLEE